MSWSSRRERTCSRAKRRSATSPAERARPATPRCAPSWLGPSARSSSTQQTKILRAFTLYFQLANIAEQHHRIRRRRDVGRADGAPRESLAEAIARLREAGVDDEALAAASAHVSLELVLTAHPTEATRRTILQSQARLGALLAELDAGEEVEERAAEEITVLWQTDEVRPQRPRVVDEIRHGLWFFEQSLLDAAEELLAAYRDAVPGASLPLSFGTWIGGDMDGNPSAGPDTIREALARAWTLGLGRYRVEVRDLAAALGLTTTLVTVSDELLESIARDERELPDYAEAIGEQNRDEPYRRKLSFVWWRLGNERLRTARRTCSPTSTWSTGACARTKANGSPTVGSPRFAAASSCSAFTWRSSTSASTRRSSPSGHRASERRSPRSPTRRPISASAPSTP